MRQFILVLLLSLLPSLSYAQQTPDNTICNERTALRWTMGTEPDLYKYRVYMSTAPMTEKREDNIYQEILHASLTPAVDAEGNENLSGQLPELSIEGPKYFRLTAFDDVGNESEMSNEAGCTYNQTPSAPMIHLYFTK